MNTALSTMPSGSALETFNVRGARALAEAFPGLPAGRLLRHLAPSDDAGGGADLRTA